MRSPDKATGGSIAARIVKGLLASARDTVVADVRIGLGYTAVLLEGGGLGVAFTFRDQAKGGCSVFSGIRPLASRPASDLLVLLESPDPIESGVGLACANALANRSAKDIVDGDILAHLDIRPDDRVGMVGHFGPLVAQIQQRSRALMVFERVARPTGLLRPAEEAPGKIPECQVAVITATSIINHTIDGLLRAAADCREVAVLGASTPLTAEPFADERVTLLSGIVANQPLEVLRVVSEGGGMRLFGPYVRKVSLKPINKRSIEKRTRR